MNERNVVRGCLYALALQLASQLALAANAPDRPRTITKHNPVVESHAKASSFAPQRHSSKHLYGAPISKPIFHNRKPAQRGSKAPATPDPGARKSPQPLSG